MNITIPFTPERLRKLVFNNISAISWRSVLLIDDTEVSEEHRRPVTSH